MGVSYYDALLRLREPGRPRDVLAGVRLPYRVLASICVPAAGSFWPSFLMMPAQWHVQQQLHTAAVPMPTPTLCQLTHQAGTWAEWEVKPSMVIAITMMVVLNHLPSLARRLHPGHFSAVSKVSIVIPFCTITYE